MESMLKTTLFGVFAVLAGAWHASATPITNSLTGLTSPTTTITFDEHVLAANSTVTNQYADLDVTFSPNVYYDPQTGFPNINGNDIGNFTFATQPAFVNPMTMSFTTPMSGVAFNMAGDATPYVFSAFLGGTLVESF